MGTKKKKQVAFIAKCACGMVVWAFCLLANAVETPSPYTSLYIAHSKNFLPEDPYSHAADTTDVDNAPVVAGSAVAQKAQRKYKNRADSVRAIEKENERAAKEQREEAQKSFKAKQKALDDSVAAARKEQEMKRKEQERAAREADREAARLHKLHSDSVKAAEKQEKKLAKARKDSLAKARKEYQASLTKRERDSVFNAHDSLKLAQIHNESVLHGLDTMRSYLSGFQRDSIYYVGERMGIPQSTIKKWGDYFSTVYGRGYAQLGGSKLRDVIIKIDTARHDARAGKYARNVSEQERAIYGKTTMSNLFNRREELLNENTLRGIKTYLEIKQEIEDRNRMATFFDSLQLVKNRKPGEMIYDKLQKRSKAREKRIWQEVEHHMKTYDLADYKDGLYGSVSLKNLFATDSAFNVVRDKLSVPFWKRFSLHTNAVEWLFAVPNIGIEFDLTPDPISHFSLLLKASWKPNLNSTSNTNSRFNYAVSSLKFEVRKYWRVGGLQTVNKERTWDPMDYSSDNGRPDTIRPRLRYIYGLYNGLHNDTVMGSEYRSDTKLKKDTNEQVIWTAGWLKRVWQPFRYNWVSGRFMNKPKTSRVYYIGGMAGYERESYVFGTKGKNSKNSFFCVTGGIVFQDLATFSNGSALDLDIGIAVGIEGRTFHKFEYNNEFDCYDYTGEHGWWVLTKYPAIKDIHVSLVYSFRPMRTKVHNLFMTEKLRKKLEEVAAANTVQKDRKTVAYNTQEYLRQRGKSDAKLLRQEYQDRRDTRAKEDSIRRKEKEERRENDKLGRGAVTNKEWEEIQRQKAIDDGTIDPNAVGEIQTREQVQPERPQYGTIDYFDINGALKKKKKGEATKPD